MMEINQKTLSLIKTIRKTGPRCKHGHTLLSHPNCFPIETADRICCLDIETFGRDADWGEVLCWVISDDTGKFKSDMRKGKSDKSVVKSCLEELSKYDVIVHHYGRKFDVPYIITRGLYHGISIPPRNTWRQIDLWRFCKDKLKLGRNSQASLARLLRKKTMKSEVDGYAWCNAAFRGDKVALQQILDHCVNDVADLFHNYQQVKHLVGRAT